MKNLFPNLTIKQNVSLKDISYIKIGGKASLIVYPKNLFELKQVLEIIYDNQLKYQVIGNCSNILFSDKGYKGVFISLKEFDSFVSIKDNNAVVRGHVSVAKLLSTLYNNSLSGLEFLYAIPGTILACVLFNVGTKTSSFKDNLTYVRYINNTGKECVLYKEDIDFAYRSKIIKEECVLFEAGFVLEKKDQKIIKNIIDEKRVYRNAAQPLGDLSLGCVFQNPKGFSAGKLIEDAGFKGRSLNQVVVSEKHANFFINKGNACAQDYLDLISQVQDVIYNKYGIKLELEIQLVGEEWKETSLI